MQSSFDDYLHQCSLNIDKNKAEQFHTQFEGKVVKWKGLVKAVDTSDLQIILDSTKTVDDEPDMMLTLLQKRIQKSADKIHVNGELTFRAQLLEYSMYFTISL